MGVLLVLSLMRFAAETNRIRTGSYADFPYFWGQAHSFWDTGRIYPLDDLERYHPGAPIHKFPPLFLLPWIPLARLGLGSAAFPLHWTLQLLMYLATLALLSRTFELRRVWLFTALVAILGLNFQPFIETLYGLQVETPLLALLTIGMFYVVRDRGAPVGMALSVAVMLKIYPVSMLAYFAIRRNWAVILSCFWGCLVLLVSQLAVVGLDQNIFFYTRLLPHMLKETPLNISENMAFARYLQSFTSLDPHSAKRVSTFITLALMLVSAWTVNRCRGLDRSPFARGITYALFVPLILMALPNSWSNYQLLLLLPIVALLAHVWDRKGTYGPVLLGVVAYGLMLFSEDTRYVLSVFQLPQPVYWGCITAKGIAAPLVWLGLLLAVRNDATSSR